MLHRKLGLNAIFAFWIAYILTRPLGASIGDYLSQPRADGGLGLGTTVTSIIFLLTILAVVVYLSLSKVDRIEGQDSVVGAEARRRSAVLVVTNKIAAAPALVEAVRRGPKPALPGSSCSSPTPSHVPFDRAGHDRKGRRMLAPRCPHSRRLQEA